MKPVLTAAEMREADRRTIQEIGLPGVVLMENAGAAVAAAVKRRYPQARRMVILCGKGNNGGDGFVVARHLRHGKPETYLIGKREDIQGDARLHLDVFERSGGRVREVASEGEWQLVRERVRDAEVVVDALLGTGLTREPSGLIGDVIRDLAERGSKGMVAVDLPSGVASDTGELHGLAVSAELTVTFAAHKYGHVLPPACDQVGELIIADIGIPDLALVGAHLYLIETEDAVRAFDRRPPGSHKGSYGHLLLIAGSVGKAGAAVLAATAALRMGTGLVTVATPAPALPAVAGGRPEIMTEPLASGPAGVVAAGALEAALVLAEARDAVVLGPGLGQDPGTRDFVRAFLARCGKPMLIDADGLNALAAAAGSPAAIGLLRRAAPTVVTPHPGEMARLRNLTTGDVQRSRLESARGLAAETGATVVLKGQRTIVAGEDDRAAVNPTGNPGMATGGTGDVLSGMIGALLARGRDPWTAATAGVFLHGSVGDRAAAALGQEAVVAGDLIEWLPETLRCLDGSGSTR